MALQDSMLKPSVFKSPSVNKIQDSFFFHPNSINATLLAVFKVPHMNN